MANPNRANRTNKAEETTKRCQSTKLCTAFSYPIKQSKFRKERQRYCGTINLPELFTTSCLYPHNAYLSSTPLTQHNSRIKRTFRPQACRSLCKNPNADDIRPPIPSCPQDMPQCANAYHGENHSRPCPQAGTCGTLSSQHCPYFLHKKADSSPPSALMSLFNRNDVVVNRLTAVYKVYIKI